MTYEYECYICEYVVARARPEAFSGGEQQRVAIARVFFR